MRIRVLFLSLTASVIFSPLALACGDSLYRVGKGVTYRNYSVPLPGTLLVYAISPDAHTLADALADSGHAVTIVASNAELAEELGRQSYDVVIAPYSERSAAETTVRSGVSFVPIVKDRDEMRQAGKEHEYVFQAGDDLKVYLKTIHKTLKSRA